MAGSKKVKHTAGEQFGSRYTQDDALAIYKEVFKVESPSYDTRALLRMEDIRVTTTEVQNALESGTLTHYEVTPSRRELRLELKGEHGDMQRFVAVVYVSCDHKIYLTDVRDHDPLGT